MQAFGDCKLTELGVLHVSACVASVPVGLSAGLRHFPLFERAKTISVALALIFAPPKAKNASNGGKNLRKRLLATQACTLEIWDKIHFFFYVVSLKYPTGNLIFALYTHFLSFFFPPLWVLYLFFFFRLSVCVWVYPCTFARACKYMCTS